MSKEKEPPSENGTTKPNQVHPRETIETTTDTGAIRPDFFDWVIGLFKTKPKSVFEHPIERDIRNAFFIPPPPPPKKSKDYYTCLGILEDAEKYGMAGNKEVAFLMWDAISDLARNVADGIGRPKCKKENGNP